MAIDLNKLRTNDQQKLSLFTFCRDADDVTKLSAYIIILCRVQSPNAQVDQVLRRAGSSTIYFTALPADLTGCRGMSCFI